MGAGILIDYNDGRPRMEITAGLRAPAYCTSFNQRAQSNKTLTINTPLTAGSQVVVALTRPVEVIEVFDQTLVIPDPFYVTSVTRNGNSGITLRGEDAYGAYSGLPQWAGVIMEVLPVGSRNAGLLVANSTDFTAISNVAKLMTCRYAKRVRVNGSMALPVSGVPFARWDDGNVSVGFDGGSIIVRNASYGGIDDVAASVDMDLVIFNNTPPTPGAGITMTNSQNQVTFSTVNKPFVYDRTINIGTSDQNIGNSLIQLSYTGALIQNNGGYNHVRMNGIRMAGNNVRVAKNRVIGNYSRQQFQMPGKNIAVPTPLLVIPNMY
ncbi:membrane protein [Sodalis phage SO-1]|uniref:Gp23 n=1 Tax=Sodalis phage SO-1 TaxID=673375 RepID=C9EHB3_9CAUD|nr:membrane protein [Sodalis phage SO1]ACV84115.1 gp23 [Sodalis phage SO1]